jgi:hypothetical protein
MLEILKLSEQKDQEIFSNYLGLNNRIRPYDQIQFFDSFSNGLKNLICIKITDGSSFFLLPGYVNPIPGFENYFDFVSPYGYSGPITSENCPLLFQLNCWILIKDYFLKENFVSCFIRLSLGLEMPGFPGEAIATMKNVRGEILEEEVQWMSFDHKVRKNVKRAQKESLNFEVKLGADCNDEDFNNFHNIYIETMRRNNAKDVYFYDIAAFKKYARECYNCCAFSFIIDDGKVISTEMVLISDDSIYSFLGGTLGEGFEKRPNDLLKFELINWARQMGKKYFVLGGGYGAEDGIFKYKKSFFPNDTVEYFTGRWEINPELYSTIEKNTMENYFKNNEYSELIIKTDFFPSYRKYKI